jgi:hypothetical protein
VSQPRFAFDPWGTAYVAYRDEAKSQCVSAMTLHGDTWTQAGSRAFTAGPVNFLSFAVSRQGVPAVAFQDVANGAQLSAMELR